VDWEKIDQVYESMVEHGEKAEEGSPEGLFFSKPMDREVEEALKELPEEYRTAIVLEDIEELSYEEAAKVMVCAILTGAPATAGGIKDLCLGKGPDQRVKGMVLSVVFYPPNKWLKLWEVSV